MLVVETISRIRREHFIKGKTIKEIARDLRVSRSTVRKVLRSGETSFKYGREVQPRPKSAFYISGEPLLAANLPRVMSFVTASRKPSVGPYPDWGRSGLLMSYATDPLDGVRHAGIYAGKILHGAKPGDLPIEQASKFSLVINLKTAKALDIAVPASLLALADEVIE